jgi:hypothetical protein
MTMKTVTINIDKDKHGKLMDEHYKLCFAKKVGDVFDVIWQSYDDYLVSNTFSWIPTYQMFGSNTFADGVKVKAMTETIDVGLGQTVTLNKHGDFLDPAVTGGPSTGITLTNNYKSIHPGLNSVSISGDGTRVTTPIYVAQDPIETGTDTLTPVDIVRVWFQQNVVTSTMISTDVTNSIDIDMTSTNTTARLYDNNDNWTTVASALVGKPNPKTYLIITVAGIGAVTAAILAGKITSLLTGVYTNIKVEVSPASGGLTISYSDRPGSAALAALVKADQTTADYLVEVTMKALVLLNVVFTSITAKVPG